ncbi:MAG: response regulator [Desulfobulbus sp.]|nr:response regulator [Desulfobulbus sp.]
MEQLTDMTHTILFVDDEAVIRQSIRYELTLEGFQVTSVASGDEAIEILEKERFDIVITDLMMPGTDGFGVLKACKRLTPMTGVIILTGYGDMRSAIDALRLGADDFTLKPCDVDELLFRIRRCLDKQNLLKTLILRNGQLEEEIIRRQEVEQQLIVSENRFRLALDVSSNGVWDRNLRTDEVYFGENWHKTLGYEHKEEINGETFEELLHPEDRERVLALRDAHAQGLSPRYEAEYRIRNMAGGWQWILSRGEVIDRDENGQALRIIGTHTDITRLKEVEAELKRAHEELEQRVLERTKELSETNVALTVLLKKREDDRQALGADVLANTEKLIIPYIDRLREGGLNEEQRLLVDIIQGNIEELTSPFATNFSCKMARLTPSELQVANLVKRGMRTKEIAAIMHLSPGTINIHRQNIRKKLDLTNQKNNLQTTLSINF